jgi:large subunit ribosomal protein L9
MKLLLKKDIAQLGIVGDVVEVAEGYGRNYLLPQHLAIPANATNVKILAEERKKAEERRRVMIDSLNKAADRLRDVEVTIAAAANEDGVLYGSVGPREIASALADEGHEVDASCIILADHIKHLDNVTVDVRFADAINAQVKVWVVRAQSEEESEDGDVDDDRSYD